MSPILSSSSSRGSLPDIWPWAGKSTPSPSLIHLGGNWGTGETWVSPKKPDIVRPLELDLTVQWWGLSAEPPLPVLPSEVCSEYSCHQTWLLQAVQKVPGGLCVAAVVGLLSGLSVRGHCWASLLSWVWVMPDWSAALGIPGAQN